MKTPLKTGTLLYAHAARDIRICPGYKYGVTVSTAAKSPKHTSPGSPKLSNIADALDRILNKQVSAIATDTGAVYCEVGTTAGTIQLYFDGNVVYVTNTDIGHVLVSLFLSHLCNPALSSGFALTLSAVTEVMASMDATTKIVGVNELASLCDCYYYDYKELFSADAPFSADQYTADTQTQVEKMLVEGKFHSINTPAELAPHIMEVFSYITWAPRGTTAGSTARGSTSRTSSVDDPFMVTPTWMNECKSGSYEIGFDWNKDDQAHIVSPDFLDDFIPNREHVKLTKLLYHELNEVVDRLNSGRVGIGAIKNNYVNAVLVGRPGTGKTTTAEALSATLGLPIYTVKVSKNTEEDTFEGMNKVAEGAFTFKDTNFLKGYQNGGIIVLEEFNLADPGVMQGALGQAIEFPFKLMRDGYEEVQRHPLCVIISTANTGTEGSRDPNQALTSRLPYVYTMNDPSEDEFLAILESKGYAKKACRSVLKAYTKILDYLNNVAHCEELAMCVTMRHCLGALKLMSIGENIYDAIYDTMIGSIGLYNLDIAQDAFKSAVKPLSL